MFRLFLAILRSDQFYFDADGAVLELTFDGNLHGRQTCNQISESSRSREIHP